MVIGTSAHEHAVDEGHACNLTQAHIIEVLSSIGRETIDFYFLRVRGTVQEFQVSGVLQALELARQEEHIRYLGLICDGDPLWQFHDAFDVVLTPRNHYSTDAYDTLSPLARERRVGIITSRPLNWGFGLPFFALPNLWRLRNLTQSFYGLTLAQAVIGELAADHPVLVGVRTPEEVRQALSAATIDRPEGLAAMLQPYIEAFDNPNEWTYLLTSQNPVYAEAAKRKLY